MKELIRFVREHSPFYRELYRDLPKEISSLSELPVLNQDEFWEANTLDANRLLTGAMADGIVLKSGGTTGRPKFSVFSRDEWNGFSKKFAESLPKNGLRAGDRVANLFFVGELYGSFIFTHKVFEQCPLGLLQLPISGGVKVDSICGLLRDYGATVIAGVPTTLLSLIAHLEEHPGLARALKVRMLLFAGESMYADQREQVERVLPGVQIRSIGYASTDAGLLGYADLSCGVNEFRNQDGFSRYEILDEESDKPITEPGRAGRAVVTDLHRRLMPVIRYPVGDRAEWVDAPGTPDRKFRLLGRSEEAARVGPVSLYYEDVRAVLAGFGAELGGALFQLVLVHRDGKDGLIVRLGANTRASDSLTARIIAALLNSRPMYRECLEKGSILPITLEWIDPGALEKNSRTGKLRRIMDQRLGT
jgi:phenylacetate-CoA ligase